MAETESTLGEPKLLFHLRIVAAVIAVAGILGSFYVIAAYVADPSAAEPEKVGVIGILGFCAILLSVAVFPFERLGLRIKSIGAVEFEQIVNNQAKERVTEISELREQIAALQPATEATPQALSNAEKSAKERMELISDFLKRYNQWAFSPSRIVAWGQQQPSFERLAQHSSDDIRLVLQELTRLGRVRTAVSKKGNTLYKWANR